MARDYEKKKYFHKNYRAILLTFLLVMLCYLSPSFAATNTPITTSPPSVNILTWWGYLDPPWVKPLIEQTCHVKLSYDEYYMTDEFLRRWDDYKNNYDIVIFYDVMYNSIKNDLEGKSKHNLSAQAKDYYPAIRDHFYQQHFLNNTAYLFPGIPGILWNPKNIQINPTDNLYQIFHKAGDHIAILLDDAISANALFNTYHDFDPFALNKIRQNTRLYIANAYDNLVNNENFAFAFSDSGVALQEVALSHGNLVFTTLPAFLFNSSDLIAQLNDEPSTTCVADLLSSRSFLNRLQKDTYFFSPYGDIPQTGDKAYLDAYRQYLAELPKMTWMPLFTNQEYEAINNWWQLMKINAGEQTLG